MERLRTNYTGKKAATEALGKAIERVRKQAGLSQPEFGRLFHRDYVTIRRWEAGEVLPHRTALADLLKMASKEDRYVFEDFLDKTLDQVLWEEYKALSRASRSLDPRWEEDPIGHANEIYGALQKTITWIWSKARTGNAEGARALARLYNQASYDSKELGENRG